jgi:hypothetical protein
MISLLHLRDGEGAVVEWNFKGEDLDYERALLDSFAH